jgi:hypothetical protein
MAEQTERSEAQVAVGPTYMTLYRIPLSHTLGKLYIGRFDTVIRKLEFFAKNNVVHS